MAVRITFRRYWMTKQVGRPRKKITPDQVKLELTMNKLSIAEIAAKYGEFSAVLRN